MKRVLALTVVVSAILSGCVAMYGTPSERRQANAALPDYSLCENLAVATLVPQKIRTEWSMELQRRGIDCSRYASTINNAAQQRQRMLNLGVQMMQQPASSSGGARPGVTCFKQREWVSGFNKNCVYSCLGSEAVQTIGATELCPLTIVR